ncbi:hypothetical protein A2U01_0083439 [Trifolium medium]|uniref:Uncharacterized protein n=1 Tax=Trifolium medium TaxID=97028 RepID=A0A392TMH6_9FABA|nr:hypothetical protein [Trifolium medium]
MTQEKPSNTLALMLVKTPRKTSSCSPLDLKKHSSNKLISAGCAPRRPGCAPRRLQVQHPHLAKALRPA